MLMGQQVISWPSPWRGTDAFKLIFTDSGNKIIMWGPCGWRGTHFLQVWTMGEKSNGSGVHSEWGRKAEDYSWLVSIMLSSWENWYIVEQHITRIMGIIGKEDQQSPEAKGSAIVRHHYIIRAQDADKIRQKFVL